MRYRVEHVLESPLNSNSSFLVHNWAKTHEKIKIIILLASVVLLLAPLAIEEDKKIEEIVSLKPSLQTAASYGIHGTSQEF